MIVTDWTIDPQENLKGTGDSRFLVEVPGGTIGGITLRAGEAPRFRIGEDVLVFLRPQVSECDVYGWFRGKYTIVNGQIREKQGLRVDDYLDKVRAEIQATLRGK